MIELVFTTCLVLMPEHCRERSLLFADITVGICTTQSQPVLARWAMDHQDWQITRWACVVHDPAQTKI